MTIRKQKAGKLAEHGPNAGLIGAKGARAGLVTPALLLDLDAFERNLSTLADMARRARVALRPHVKTHKCSHIADLQVRQGAVGVCVATLREARAMAAAGIPGILLTSPVAGAAKCEALVALRRKVKDLKVVADHPVAVKELEHAARRARAVLEVLVDVDPGMGRTGTVGMEATLALATQIAESDVLEFRGLQFYSGMTQHIAGIRERARSYGTELQRLGKIIEALERAGLSPGIVTGGGTGTFEIDRGAGLFTECQPGSYVFLDVQYGQVELFRETRHKLEKALFVQTTVVSCNQREMVTVDGGFKCFAADGPSPVVSMGAPEGSFYQFYGDEFGRVQLPRGSAMPGPGEKMEFVVPHCDPTVNLHDYYHCMRGDTLIDVWRIDARGVL